MDCVDKGLVEIKYCPTILMWADYFTKPLQVSCFKRYRDVIMGYVHINDLLLDKNFPLKERVEKMNIVIQILKSSKKSSVRRVAYAEALVGKNRIVSDKNV